MQGIRVCSSWVSVLREMRWYFSGRWGWGETGEMSMLLRARRYGESSLSDGADE